MSRALGTMLKHNTQKVEISVNIKTMLYPTMGVVTVVVSDVVGLVVWIELVVDCALVLAVVLLTVVVTGVVVLGVVVLIAVEATVVPIWVVSAVR